MHVVGWLCDGCDSSDPDDGAVSALLAVARVTSARVSRHTRWINSTELQQVAPRVAQSAQRCVRWLRDLGTLVTQASRLLADERREKRSQGRVLHDEIHSLRVKVRLREGGRGAVNMCARKLTRAWLSSVGSSAVILSGCALRTCYDAVEVPLPLVLEWRCVCALPDAQSEALAQEAASFRARSTDLDARLQEAVRGGDAETSRLRSAVEDARQTNLELRGALDRSRASISELTAQLDDATRDLGALREENAGLASSGDATLSRLREHESKGGLQ